MAQNDKIKLLIVDDSFLMRKILIELLSEEDDIEIVGEAADGEDAFLKTKSLRPDIITMDYNMPLMNGLEAIKKIRREMDYFPAIIMISAKTREGANDTLECMRQGAIDFIPKPSGEISVDIKRVYKELVLKIRTAIKARGKIGKKEKKEVKEASEKSIEAVVIGASTGGPPVVEDIIKSVSITKKATLLVVQHMPRYFTSSLAKRLDKLSKIEVREAKDGEELVGGSCLIAPGGKHMMIVRDKSKKVVVNLTDQPLRNGFRPSIDYAMESVAQIYKEKTMGIILTGMGFDGTDGMVEIKNKGGYTIAQSPEEAIVDSMPESAIETGSVNEVLEIEKIIKRVSELCA